LLDVMRQICDALDVTHKAGIIHRDLKPSNIFISLKAGAPHIKLLDFGVAKVQFQEDAKQLTSTGMIMGTPSYIAPEQLMPENELTAATDIYALGVILFEALTGRLPIDGGHSIEHATLVLTQEPLTLGALRPEFANSALEELLGQMLQKDPHKRPSSMKALWQSFQQALIALSRQPVQKPKKSQLASRCISLDTPTELPLPAPKKSQEGVQSAPIAFTFKGGQLVAAAPPSPMSEGSSTPSVRIKPSGEHESLDVVELRPPSSDELAQTFDLPEEITKKYKPTPPPQTETKTPVKATTPASSTPSLERPHTFDHTTPLPLHEDVRPKHHSPITSKHFEDTEHPARPQLSKQTQPKKNVQASKRISQERDKLQPPPSSDSKLILGVVLVFMLLLGSVNLYLYLRSPSPQYELPTRLKRVWQRGQQASQQKQFDTAITFFEQVTRDRAWKQSLTYPRLYARIARLHAKKKRYTYAIRYMRMYIRDVKQLYRTYQQLRKAPPGSKKEYKLSLLRRQLPNTKTFNTEKWALSSWEEALRQKKKKD
ncbi:MAG TPA: hypothetical protein DCE42_26310, partial [Myxococcales bacterium]|nr:hypothetical protein [Myxococcales bacterium]